MKFVNLEPNGVSNFSGKQFLTWIEDNCQI